MIDLHMHSLYSEDGEFTPLELIKKCTENDVNIMCITDHNSVRASRDFYEIERNIENQSVRTSHIMLEKTRSLGFPWESKTCC